MLRRMRFCRGKGAGEHLSAPGVTAAGAGEVKATDAVSSGNDAAAHHLGVGEQGDALVGRARYCSPRHRLPQNACSIN